MVSIAHYALICLNEQKEKLAESHQAHWLDVDAIPMLILDRRNFKKPVLSMNILKKLDEKDTSGSKKGAFLYPSDKAKYEVLSSKGFNVEV